MMNFNFGVVEGIKMSIYGIAVPNNENIFVSYDKSTDSLIEVEGCIFDAGSLVYALPSAVKDIEIGNVIYHQGNPVFVTSIENGIKVIDIKNGERKEIMPARSIFGFNFVTKLTTLIDFEGKNEACEEKPFGNMLPFLLMSNGENNNNNLLPLMLLSNKDSDKEDNYKNLMLMFMLNNNGNKGGSEGTNFFPIMAMMGLI